MRAYFDLDVKKNTIMVRDMITEKIINDLPKSLLNYDPKRDNSVQAVFNRVSWHDSSTLRIINRAGLEKLYNFENGEQLEYNMIPLYENSETHHRHYNSNRAPLDQEDTFNRLRRKYQFYKSAYFLYNQRVPHQLYNGLFEVDHLAGAGQDRYIIDMSFTFLHWKIMELLVDGEISINQVDEN